MENELGKPILSVILCAHNPRETVITRVFASLAAQNLSLDQWELVLVDNASSPPLMNRGWCFPANCHYVVEFELGLTPARIAGIGASRGNVLVFVDDDTVLDINYLTVALNLMADHPEIGAAGGRIKGEFAIAPPLWSQGYLDLLAIRDFGDLPIRALIYNEVGPWEPCGAGMIVRASVARAYSEKASDPGRRSFDRVGKTLSSCGDTDLARTAADLGYYLAYEPNLVLNHVIPQSRLHLIYLTKLAYNVQKDGWLLYRLRGKQCFLAGWRVWLYVLVLPIKSFSFHPCRWLLKTASAYGQIKGRSCKLRNGN